MQEFFADCDAVLLCLDPEGRRRRPPTAGSGSKKWKTSFERYLDRSNDGTTGRPGALLFTKFERVLDRAQATTEDDDDPASWGLNG